MLQDQVALVTGASRGIGKAAALTLAEHGAHVAINGRDLERLEEVAAAIEAKGRQSLILTGDISQTGIGERFVEQILEKWGSIEILVNNAGMIRREPTAAMDRAAWERVLEVNLTGTMLTCQAVLPAMEKAGYGKIINISSTAAKLYHAHSSPSYGASKAGVLYLTRHLAMEYAPKGIYVNAICPGPVATEMTDTWDPQFRANMLATIPLGRMGTTQEIADVVLFLASSMSNFIVGETINANGGIFLD
ncbi:MAG: SDR family NAD(P)-dependent oxidoreductase [Limnochordia bacterium]